MTAVRTGNMRHALLGRYGRAGGTLVARADSVDGVGGWYGDEIVREREPVCPEAARLAM